MTDINDMMQHLEAAKQNSRTESETEQHCSNCAKDDSKRTEKVEIVHHGTNRKGAGTEQRLTRRVCPECGTVFSGASY
jgi:hypothetical protein